MSDAGKQRVIVVGGGLAGLASSVKVAELGLAVDLFSVVPVKRSHSVCAQGGINACNEVARQQGYSEYEHFSESVYGGDYLAEQSPVYEMAHWAPRIIELLDRMGVPFNRTSEGRHDLRLFGGSLYKRTHFSGATTGQQLLYALDEQARRHESDGLITKYEHWEFLGPILDASGACRGIVAQDQRTMQIRAFRAACVVMATGGMGLVFGRSTNSVMCNGAATARCFMQGAAYGNPEMIQVHPTAIPGYDKLRLMSESARGEGGRVWVPRAKGDARDPREIPEGERYYFLEEKYPKYGNIVPRDIATREIFDICVNQGMGVGGKRQVYLDLSHLSREYLERKLGGIIDIYRKFVGEEPSEVPMRIFPGVHYSMGGLWVDFEPKPDHRGMVLGSTRNLQTTVPGLFAAGECNYQYHGANRLGANALLSCIFDGLFGGLSFVNYCRDHAGRAAAPEALYADAVSAQESRQQSILSGAGGENAYDIAHELGEVMTDRCTVVKEEAGLNAALAEVESLKARAARISLPDRSAWTNQSLCHARATQDMLVLAEAILKGSIQRKESRGAHYRTDYPQRDDSQFMATTIATWDTGARAVRVELRPITATLERPKARTYGRVEGEATKAASAPAPAGAAH